MCGWLLRYRTRLDRIIIIIMIRLALVVLALLVAPSGGSTLKIGGHSITIGSPIIVQDSMVGIGQGLKESSQEKEKSDKLTEPIDEGLTLNDAHPLTKDNEVSSSGSTSTDPSVDENAVVEPIVPKIHVDDLKVLPATVESTEDITASMQLPTQEEQAGSEKEEVETGESNEGLGITSDLGVHAPGSKEMGLAGDSEKADEVPDGSDEVAPDQNIAEPEGEIGVEITSTVTVTEPTTVSSSEEVISSDAKANHEEPKVTTSPPDLSSNVAAGIDQTSDMAQGQTPMEQGDESTASELPSTEVKDASDSQEIASGTTQT